MRRQVVQLFTGNLVSKLLGAGREVLNAALFGTGQVIGAYRVAQVGTLVPINFFTSDSLNAAFVPLYRRLQRESVDMAQTLFWSLSALFGAVAVLVFIVVVFLARQWESVLAPGLGPGVDRLATEMLKVMGIGVPFYLLSALVMYLSLAHDDYVPMAVRPSVQNVGLVVGALAAFLMNQPLMLALGFTCAYVVFSVWATVRAWRVGIMQWPAHWSRISTRVVLGAFWRTLRPLILLPVFLQGTIVVERVVASLIGLDAVSGIDYAKFVTEGIITLISVPIALAGLGEWSGPSSAQTRPKVLRTAVLVLVLAVAVSSFLAMHTRLVVDVAYSRGAFGAASARVTSDILFGLTLGLWAQVLGYILVKALNAELRNHVVFWVMSLALAVNAGFDLVAYRSLGAVALGVGNSIYGIVLLVGALVALRMGRAVLARTWWLAVAVAGYVLLALLVPVDGPPWLRLVVVSTIALGYWSLWVAFVPGLRGSVLGLVRPYRARAG